MARRVELGAGIAAVVLSLLSLSFVLLAPLVAGCPVALDARGRCPSAATFVTLLASTGHVDPGVWWVIGLMLAVPLMGALGAIMDGAPGGWVAVATVIAGALLTLLGWAALLSQGSVLGPFYLPPLLALGVAALASVIRRRAPRRRGDSAV
ncbi:MAG TPA: hypothetical protein VIG30_18420 [Ktedonobacterales bacterium]